MNIGVDLGTRRIALACPEVDFAFSDELKGVRLKRDYPGEWDAGYALGRRAALAMSRAGFLPGHAVKFYFERPMSFKSARTAIGQAFSAGAVFSQLVPFGHAIELSNTTWKKELIGHGNADKDTCRGWLEGNYPALAEICGEDQDLVDAHCIALWAELAS